MIRTFTAGARTFAKMGASIDDPVVRQFDGVEDIIVRTGSSDEIIVIGAHYDFVDRGCGAIDNWSGIVTLAHLYRSIRMLSAHKTVLFVAFGKEEEGLLGSKAMAAAIPPDQLSNYCAMINVDSVGLAKLFALENASSSSLVELAKKTAARMNIPFYTTRVKGDSDSSSFAAREIPAITLSGLSNDWTSILHTPSDQASRVDPVGVYLGYRLALAMWQFLDGLPCTAYHSVGKRPSLLR